MIRGFPKLLDETTAQVETAWAVVNPSSEPMSFGSVVWSALVALIDSACIICDTVNGVVYATSDATTKAAWLAIVTEVGAFTNPVAGQFGRSLFWEIDETDAIRFDQEPVDRASDDPTVRQGCGDRGFGERAGTE